MRIVFIILVIIPLFALPTYYLGKRLDYGLTSWIFVCVLSLLSFGFPLLRGKKWVKASFIAMGFLSFFFVTFIVRDLIGLTGYLLEKNLTILFAVTLTLSGLWWGHKPRLKKVIIPLSELPLKLDGTTIVQISDLHVGVNIKRDYVQKVVNTINEQAPNMIVLTGDIGDSPPEIYAAEMESFKQLKHTHGIYYVTGNHEYYWNMPAWVQVMQNLGAITLLNAGHVIHKDGQQIFMGGITDPMDRKNPPNVASTLSAAPATSFKILLSHRPDPAPKASQLGYHLQLSGHTHGGQFFPWTLAVMAIHKHHAGLFTQGKMKIYVSTGTGSWGPMLRLGSMAEITHITLKKV